MSKQKRFNKRKNVLKGLAIAVVATSTVPLTSNAENTQEQTNTHASLSIKSVTSVDSKAKQASARPVGTDFNAGKNANNGKKKEKPKPIRLNLNP